MPIRTYKYRLSPTKAQMEKLEWTLIRCCELYNAALQERKEAWKYAHESMNFAGQCRSLTSIRNEIRQEYQEIGSHVLQNVLHRVDNAFKDFFRRVKAGEKPGYPRYQSVHRYDSFCFPDAAGWKIVNTRLQITNLGSIKVKWHRELQGKVKTTTVKREGSCWYVCFACEVEAMSRTPYTDETVGIDLGVSKLATLSTGDVIENPKHYRRAEKRLAKAGQALSRKKRGSHRRKKAVQRVAKLHRKVRNQRNDSLHQWSRRLIDTYEVIVFEDIAPANLSRRAKPKQDEETGQYLPNGASAKSGLNKSILDAGWHQFIMFCTYKVEETGGRVVLVDPKYTSQVCSSCGTVRKKALSQRWHSCECGCELDRDHNAAINIKALWFGRNRQEA
ncbi:RNA-guided endonuclease InsQ/TnpB family protein [Ktedonospora formicarum]|uniref:Transposase n=1 Tax=Ktedonospora formicarum TaxID=2778364 RepID=A0A8J3I7R7_9CHLR|nr:transposase [Ktedonospora formicarum]GHO48405.1 transposase [Ktedonospora formicarum]